MSRDDVIDAHLPRVLNTDMLSCLDAADTWRLSLATPMFKDQPPEAEAPLAAVAEWLTAHIVDESNLPGGHGHAEGGQRPIAWTAPIAGTRSRKHRCKNGSASSGNYRGSSRVCGQPAIRCWQQLSDCLPAERGSAAAADTMVTSPTHSTGSRGSMDSLPPAGQIVQGGPSL